MRFKTVVLLVLFYVVLFASLLPAKSYFIFVFSIILIILIPVNRCWNKSGLNLLLFSGFYVILQMLNGNMSDSLTLSFIYLVSPISFYRFGRYIMLELQSDNSRQLLLVGILLSYLSVLFYYTYLDISIVGVINYTRFLLSDLNYKELAATLYGLMASVGIGCVSTIFIRNQPVKYKMIFFIISLFSILSVVHLINRTGVIIAAASVVVTFIVTTKMRMERVLSALVILIIIAFIILETNMIDEEILNAYMNREKSSYSDSSSAGGRTEIWLNAINHMINMPFGWELDRYAHNMWLDIARVSGWFALIPFCVVSIEFLKNWYVVAKQNTTIFGILVLIITFSMFLNSAVEPVIDGSPLFFLLSMFFWAVMERLAIESKTTN